MPLKLVFPSVFYMFMSQYLTIMCIDATRVMGKGVCIYVKDIFTAIGIDVTTERPEGIEGLWLTVQYHKLPSGIIFCQYRHQIVNLANAKLCN